MPGEVRVRQTGGELTPQLSRVLDFCDCYDPSLNFYTNNCRTFCSRVEQEVERLNREAGDAATPL